MVDIKLQVYLAGPLFTKSEMKQRLNDEKILKENFKNLDIFNPINLNKKEQIDNENLKDLSDTFFYEKDEQEIYDSDIMIADIDNNDPGTLVELGMFIQLKRMYNRPRKLFILYSNWKGKDIVNKFLWGACVKESDGIFKDINGVVHEIRKMGVK